jgi:hypothetical protein
MDFLEEFFQILYWHVHLRITTKIVTMLATAFEPELSERKHCKASYMEGKNTLRT